MLVTVTINPHINLSTYTLLFAVCALCSKHNLMEGEKLYFDSWFQSLWKERHGATIQFMATGAYNYGWLHQGGS